jgi:hypothetical protein
VYERHVVSTEYDYSAELVILDKLRQGHLPEHKVHKTHAEHRVRPVRVEMLAEAMSLTWGERDREYGDPLINGAAAGELKALLRKHTTRELHPAEQEFLEMALTKIARIITGTKVRADSYIDAAAYMAMAGEVAERSKKAD